MPKGHPFLTVGDIRPNDNAWLQGSWETDQRIAMDAAFVEAMTKAGYTITSPSTVHGTKCPVVGYQRDD
jgi:hypothetical protein